MDPKLGTEILDGLLRGKQVLTKLTSTVLLLNRHVELLLTYQSVKELSETEAIVGGDPSAIICLPTAGIKNDKLGQTIESLSKKGKLPTLLKLGDFYEDWDTTEKVVHFLETQLNMDSETQIVNLRWATMIPPLESQNTIVIGKRYALNLKKTLRALRKKLEKGGFRVVEDDGEYGGGRIAYRLMQKFQSHNVIVFEMTVCESVAKDPMKVKRVLESILN